MEEQLHVMLSQELKKRIELAAKAKGLSVNAFIRMIVIEKLEEGK